MESSQVQKAIKRRASRACERCRGRKVRCDIVHQEDGCTNCKLDNIECLDVPTRRQSNSIHRPHKRHKSIKPAVAVDKYPEIRMATSTDLATIPPAMPDTPAGTLVSQPAPQPTTEPLNLEPPDMIQDHFPDFTSGLLKGGIVPVQMGILSPATSVDESISATSPESARRLSLILPEFIQPIKSEKCLQYASFLESSGMFETLSHKLRVAIITSYVHFVHPQLPIIDVHDLLLAIATNGREGRVSILLFQAVMLAGAAYVENEYIMEAGYQSRVLLRKELADRARMLYDFDCETDRLVLVQSLVLMTSWQEKGDEVKHLRHWIGIAYHIAIFIGLNKAPNPSTMPPKKQRLWRRVWWSCYIRDRTLAFGLRHAPIIPVSAIETPDLTPEDFEIRPLTLEMVSCFPNITLLCDRHQQVQLSEVCVAQQKLCHYLGQILEVRHKTTVVNFGCTSTRTLVSVPDGSKFGSPESKECAASLESWFRDLALPLKYKSPPCLKFTPEQDLLVFHCALLNLFYYSLVCMLHRPWPPPIFRALPASEVFSQRKARHAANAIMTILQDLNLQEMIQLLPTSGITFIVQAAVTHLCDSTTSVDALRTQSQQHLDTCVGYLSRLKDVHIYAPLAKTFLLTAAAKLYRNPQYAHLATNSPSPGSRRGGDKDLWAFRPKLDPHLEQSSDDLALVPYPTASQSDLQDDHGFMGSQSDVVNGSFGELLDVFDFGLFSSNNNNMRFELDGDEYAMLL